MEARHAPYRTLTFTLAAVCLTGIHLPSAAQQAIEAGGPALENVGAGELLWRSGEGLTPLPVVSTDVEVDVTGVLVRASVTQRFRNSTDETIEAVYAFPLPERAAVHRMEMTVGERRIRSVVREREEARRVYEGARRTGRKAALLDQQRPNLFTTELANLDAGESVVVRLQYLEEVDARQDAFELRLPLTFLPRYGAPVTETREGCLPAPVVGPSARIVVRLQPGLPLESIGSETHAISWVEEPAGYVVHTVRERVVADRDFVLQWQPRRGELPSVSAFVEERDGEQYASILLLPPAEQSPDGAGLPTETLFIVDVSGSMAGPSMKQARGAMHAALRRLRPEDRFNVLAFNDGRTEFRTEFRQADAVTLESARKWLGALEATGGTEILGALTRGIELAGESRSTHVQRIVFMTDGAVSNEDAVLRAVRENLGRVRLHTVGIGHAPNGHLMRKMASLGRGVSEFVSTADGATNRIDDFLARIDRPVLGDVRLEWEGVEPDESDSMPLPDLHAGEPLSLYLRLGAPHANAAVRLGGFGRSGWLEHRFELTPARQADAGIAVRWARSRVDALMDRLYAGEDPEGVRAAVVEIGLQFGLVTRFTSLVAVDDRPTALGAPRRTNVANGLPVGGSDTPLRRLVALALTVAGLLVLALTRSRPDA